MEKFSFASFSFLSIWLFATPKIKIISSLAYILLRLLRCVPFTLLREASLLLLLSHSYFTNWKFFLVVYDKRSRLIDPKTHLQIAPRALMEKSMSTMTPKFKPSHCFQFSRGMKWKNLNDDNFKSFPSNIKNLHFRRISHLVSGFVKDTTSHKNHITEWQSLCHQMADVRQFPLLEISIIKGNNRLRRIQEPSENLRGRKCF